MKLAIIYATRYGSTEEVAYTIKELHPTDVVDLISIDSQKKLDLSSYDVIILGSPIYFGKPLPAFRQFIQLNISLLCQKPLGLFLVGINEKAALKAVEKAIPEKLINHAYAISFLGGVFSINTLSLWEKCMVRLLKNSGKEVSPFKPELLQILKFNRQISYHPNIRPSTSS